MKYKYPLTKIIIFLVCTFLFIQIEMLYRKRNIRKNIDDLKSNLIKLRFKLIPYHHFHIKNKRIYAKKYVEDHTLLFQKIGRVGDYDKFDHIYYKDGFYYWKEEYHYWRKDDIFEIFKYYAPIKIFDIRDFNQD